MNFKRGKNNNNNTLFLKEKVKIFKIIVEFLYLNIQWINYDIKYYRKKRDEDPRRFTRKSDLLVFERLLNKVEVILAVASHMIHTNELYTLDLFTNYYKQNIKYRLYYLQARYFSNYTERFLDLWLSALYHEEINDVFIVDLESDLVTNLELRHKLLEKLKLYIKKLSNISDKIYLGRCLYKPSSTFLFLVKNINFPYKDTSSLYFENDKITRNRYLFELFEFHYYTVKNIEEARDLYFTLNLFYQYAGKAAIDFLYFEFRANELVWVSPFYERRHGCLLKIKKFLQNKKKRFDQELIDLIEESLGFESYGFRLFFSGNINSVTGR